MDNHPIPQDVTGFQFKLVGNMTVKQFGLLAAPIIAAAIIYYIPGGFLFLVIFKCFAIPFLSILGVVLAFVPLEGRPIDIMARHFIKALFAPNQYVFHKVGSKLAISMVQIQKAAAKPVTNKQAIVREQKLEAYIHNIHQDPKNPLDAKEEQLMATLSALATKPTLPTNSPQPPAGSSQQIPHLTSLPKSPLPTPTPPVPDDKKIPEASAPKLEHNSQQQIRPLQEPSSVTQMAASSLDHSKKETMLPPLPKAPDMPAPSPVSTPTLPPEHLTQQLHEVMEQKQQLENELKALKDQLAKSQTPTVPQPLAKSDVSDTSSTVSEKKAALPVVMPPAPSPSKVQQPLPPVKEQQPHVFKVPKTLTASVGTPVTPDVPNLLSGIIKDSRGNVLQNILVEVKDKEGNPVRAFKTNPLGQFASATPLSNGIFTIEFEDPKAQHRFDTIELAMKGEIVQPIEVISHDAREELRKALFS